MTQSGPPPSQPPSTPPPSAPPPDWQSTPQQPSAPAAGGGTPSWTANLTSQQAVAGPAGYFYADVPNRIIAFIIDSIILAIIGFIVGIVTGFLPSAVEVNPNATNFGDFVRLNPVGALIDAILGLLVSGLYFVYTWTKLRGSPGMKVLGMQVGNASDGRSISINQAIIRFLVLFGPSSVANALFFAPSIGFLLGLLSFIWLIVLLVTTAQSPTKQGLHDRYAQTVVVKAGRSVG
jgi:uncharacterized RDD family membrane protein YckC